MAVVSEDIVFPNVTSGERVAGATAFRAHVAGIQDRWPDLAFEERALYLTADAGVAEWVPARPRRTGPGLSGTGSTGTRLAYSERDSPKARATGLTPNRAGAIVDESGVRHAQRRAASSRRATRAR